MSAPDRAHELVTAAAALASAGAWAAGSDALEEAATVHAQAGRRYDEARCLQLGATLRRSAGDVMSAGILAERARALAPADDALTLSVLAERAEIATAECRYADAIAVWTDCIAAAHRIGSPSRDTVALLRRRAACFIAVDADDEADADFTAACAIADATSAGFLRAEQAGLLLDYGRVGAAAAVIPLGDPDDVHVRAQTLVVRARIARAAGDARTQRTCATAARSAALQATAPVAYFAAAVQLSDALDALGMRAESYAALATAWVTLGDLLGRDVARSWVGPCLSALRARWGEAAFARAKDAHDAARRAERLGSGKP